MSTIGSTDTTGLDTISPTTHPGRDAVGFRAIRAAAAGEAIFGPEIAQRVIDHFTNSAGPQTTAFPALTERERQVLELIAAGKGNASIAHELMINLKTVRNHVSNIFTKLQVSDRSAAIVKARQSGLGGS